MQTINFTVPQGWHELSDKQLRYVYRLLADNYEIDELKTLCFLRWTGTKVIGKQPSEKYLLRHDDTYFEVSPVDFAALLQSLNWLAVLPTVPIRIASIARHHALAADFQGVAFEKFLVCENLYQGFLSLTPSMPGNASAYSTGSLHSKSFSHPASRSFFSRYRAAMTTSLAQPLTSGRSFRKLWMPKSVRSLRAT
jgi:hypothetical protein